QQYLRLRLERLRFEAMLQGRAVLLLRDPDVGLAGRIQRIRIPAQCLGFIDSALDVISQRTRPIYGELRAELMADPDRVPDPESGLISSLRSFSRGAGGPDRVIKSLGGDHGARDSILSERALDPADDRRLLLVA